MTNDDDRSAGAEAAAENSAQSAETASFEESLSRLGDLVARLESGALGLTESIAAYEQGVGLLRRLHDELNRAEERVALLVRIDEEGRPVLAPLTEQALDAPATPARPAGRRRSAPRRLPGMDDPAGPA